MEKEWKKTLIHLFCSTVKSSFISTIGFSIGIGNLIDDVSLGDHVSIVLCWLQQFCTGGALIRLAFSPRGFCSKPTKGPCFDRNQPLYSDLVDEKEPPSSNQQQTSMEK
ncbi:conserved hypothetical protein [Trichinella spiralis]|uniref:hypothetical protein n=1 Tax=Trichinella spiralis TaxID=6334 RepID=UPI0001EFC9FD|nr:conserved hypothetical protein [Trichinella spiralis]